MTIVLNARKQVAAKIEVAEHWVVVVPGEVQSIADAWRLQQAIEATLMATSKRRALLDARDCSIMPREADESMWQWVGTVECLDALAIVNQLPVRALAQRMKALAVGAKRVGVFLDWFEATRWLLRQPRRRHVSEIRRVPVPLSPAPGLAHAPRVRRGPRSA